MDELKTAIDESRNIKPNSLRAYLISIKKLWEATEKGEMKNIDFLEDFEHIKDYMDNLKISTQKNYLASIIVSLDAMNNKKGKYDKILMKYREYLEEIHKKYKEEYESGKKSESQDKNWTTMKELTKVMNSLKRDIQERELFTKNELNNKQISLIQKWVVANLFLHPENPPTRLDYAPMEIITKTEYDKLEDEERKENNYLVIVSRNKKFFSFNEYKTSKKYGTNEIAVGKKLNSVLNIWLKFNTSDSLLINSKGDPLSSNGLGKLIKSTFASTGKNISSNMLRHIFLSEKYPNIDKEKEADAKKMGHSVSQQGKYSLVDE